MAIKQNKANYAYLFCSHTHSSKRFHKYKQSNKNADSWQIKYPSRSQKPKHNSNPLPINEVPGPKLQVSCTIASPQLHRRQRHRQHITTAAAVVLVAVVSVRCKLKYSRYWQRATTLGLMKILCYNYIISHNYTEAFSLFQNFIRAILIIGS